MVAMRLELTRRRRGDWEADLGEVGGTTTPGFDEVAIKLSRISPVGS